MTDRLGTMVAMETAAPHSWLLQSYVFLYQQSERSAASVRDTKLTGLMRTDRLIKGYVWAKMKQPY